MAAIAAAMTDPPWPRIATAANCALPAYTNADIAIAAAPGMPAARAEIPKEMATTNTAAANGIAARAPARSVVVVGEVVAIGALTASPAWHAGGRRANHIAVGQRSAWLMRADDRRAARQLERVGQQLVGP